MDKTVFVQKMSALEHARQKALEYNRRETDKISKEFIDENCKLAVGDTVMLGDQKGVVEEIEVTPDGYFFGKWKKFKKNGELYTLSHTFYSFDYENMTKVESQK